MTNVVRTMRRPCGGDSLWDVHSEKGRWVLFTLRPWSVDLGFSPNTGSNGNSFNSGEANKHWHRSALCWTAHREYSVMLKSVQYNVKKAVTAHSSM